MLLVWIIKFKHAVLSIAIPCLFMLKLGTYMIECLQNVIFNSLFSIKDFNHVWWETTFLYTLYKSVKIPFNNYITLSYLRHVCFKEK